MFCCHCFLFVFSLCFFSYGNFLDAWFWFDFDFDFDNETWFDSCMSPCWSNTFEDMMMVANKIKSKNRNKTFAQISSSIIMIYFVKFWKNQNSNQSNKLMFDELTIKPFKQQLVCFHEVQVQHVLKSMWQRRCSKDPRERLPTSLTLFLPWTYMWVQINSCQFEQEGWEVE